jgi:gamma-glutamylcyclotransferase (GGCT)/AIG2-like uncharacterized protein YtfP
VTAAEDLVFVYGTLRTGQANHRLHLGGRSLRPAVLDGYELRLGDWPWVRPAAGSSVAGEVAAVAPEGLARLDLLEDVAHGWYRRERCTVRLDPGGEIEAWTYTAGSIAASGSRPVPGGDWIGGFTWYVGYGSNLSAARFRRYLDGCRDRSEPWRWAPVEVRHRLLFARQSTRWGGGGVAFLDPSPDPAERTLGRGWLLTWEQLADVQAQECRLAPGSVEVPVVDQEAEPVVTVPDRWYGCLLPLGQLDGWPMVTVTDAGAAALPPNPPGPAYRAVIARGLVETHGLTTAEADAYLARHSP